MILQHVYRPILNFIYEKITFRISDRARTAIIFLAFFVIFFSMFAKMYLDLLSGKERDLLVLLMMGIVILFSVDRKLEILKWNLVIYIPFAFMGVYMLIISLFFHSIGDHYSVFLLFVLFVTICLAFVWGNRGDYRELFKIVCASYVLFYLILLVWCFARYGLYFGESYTMWMNTNGFVKVVCPAIGCGMYLFMFAEHRGWKIFFAAVSGAAATMIVFTTCKTAQLAMVMIFIGFVVLLAIKQKDAGKKSGKSFLCFLIVFILGFGLTTGFLHIVTPVITNDPAATHVNVFKTTNEVDTAPVDMSSPYEIYKQQTIREIQKHPFWAKLDDIGTGRIHMWVMYLKRLNMTGNVKTLRNAGPHNQYIDLAYRAGFPVGAMWLFILLAVFVYIIHGIVKRKGEWVYYVTLCYPTFLWFSLLETGLFPAERGFILLYYLSLTPLLIKAPIRDGHKGIRLADHES